MQIGDSRFEVAVIEFEIYVKAYFMLSILKHLLLSVMNSIQSSKSFYSSPLGLEDSPYVQLITSGQMFPQQYPLSAGSATAVGLPPCINHKRKVSKYVVTLSDGERIHFCEKCMESAKKQGFEGVKVSEFHGTPISKCPNKMKKRQDSSNKVTLLHIYLDKLKKLLSQVGSLKDKLENAFNLISNQNEIERLLQILQMKIKSLKEEYHRNLSVKMEESSKIWQQMRSKTIWMQQDLEYLISKVCKHYDSLLVEPEQTFKVHIILMNQSLQQQEKHLQSIQVQFSEWQNSLHSLNQTFYLRSQKLWEDYLMDCSLSNITFQAETDKDNSPRLYKIIQELSTTHALA